MPYQLGYTPLRRPIIIKFADFARLFGLFTGFIINRLTMRYLNKLDLIVGWQTIYDISWTRRAVSPLRQYAFISSHTRL